MSSLAALLDRLQAPEPLAEAVSTEVDSADVHAAAYAAGETEGRAAAEAALAPLRAELASAAAALRAAVTIDPVPLRPVLAALVRQLCEAVLAHEVALHENALLALAEQALACVQPDEAPVLAASPETLERLAPHLPDIATRPDAALAPGSLSVSAPTFRIDVDLAERLALALEALA